MAEKSAAFVTVDLGASGGKVSVGTFGGEQFSLAEAYRFDNGGVTVWAHAQDGQVTAKSYWDDLALYSNIVEGLRRAATLADAPSSWTRPRLTWIRTHRATAKTTGTSTRPPRV